MTPREALDLVYMEVAMSRSPDHLPVVEAVQVLRDALDNLDDIGGRYAALTVASAEPAESVGPPRELVLLSAGLLYGLSHHDAPAEEIAAWLGRYAVDGWQVVSLT